MPAFGWWGIPTAPDAAETNRQMGLKRANVVAQYLGSRLTNPQRITEVLSDGEDNLLPNFRPESAKQRRVTVFARKCLQP